MKPIKVGILGCGKQAPKHIAGLREIEGVSTVVADIRPELAETLASRVGVPWLPSPDALFHDPAVDAVDICAPTSAHQGLITQAVSAGKHFFCEKPLCEDYEAAQAIHELTRGRGTVGMVGFIYRFAPVFEEARRILNGVPETGISPVLGRIVAAHFRIGGRGSHQLWKHRRTSGGGALKEMMVHMLDLSLWLLGPVEDLDVLAFELRRPEREIQGRMEEVDAEDYVALRAEHRNGIRTSLQADLLTPAFSQFVEIQGERGTFMGSIQPDTPSFVFCEQAANGYARGKTPLAFGKVDLFQRQMAEFVSAVRENRPPSRSTVEESLKLMKMMDKIQKRSEKLL